MVRTLAVLMAVLAAAPAVRAQDAKSADLAKQLAQLLEGKQLDSIAAADPHTPGQFAAALSFPGTQLLVVSAKYAAPQLLTDKLAAKQYREVYIDLSSASIPGSKVFVMDTFGDGLMMKPKGDAPPDSVERGDTSVTFDGEPKKAKMSDADYAKAFDASEEAYTQILRLLIGKLQSGT